MKLFTVNKSSNKIKIEDKLDYYLYYTLDSKLENAIMKNSEKYSNIEPTEENKNNFEKELNSAFEKWLNKNIDKKPKK